MFYSRSRGIRSWVSVGIETIFGFESRIPVRVESIRSWVPVGKESFRGWVPLGLSPVRVESCRGWVHLGLSPFGFEPVGVESRRGWGPSRSSPFGLESIRDWVYSGLGPFAVGSIRGWVFLGSVILCSVVLGSVGATLVVHRGLAVKTLFSRCREQSLILVRDAKFLRVITACKTTHIASGLTLLYVTTEPEAQKCCPCCPLRKLFGSPV
jgi:hypothetical protein